MRTRDHPVGDALAVGDVRRAFRLVRRECRRQSAALRKRHGIGPGFSAIVLGRALQALAEHESEATMRRAVPYAHAAMRTLQRARPRVNPINRIARRTPPGARGAPAKPYAHVRPHENGA
jgi:hypothetical protein